MTMMSHHNRRRRLGPALLLFILWTSQLADVVKSDEAVEENTCAADGSCYVADCRDEDSQCEQWAKQGLCDSKLPETTKVKCRKSCPNVCDDGSFDWGEPQEANNDETKYAVAQSLEYLHTLVHADPDYEAVRSKCKNKHKQCSYWAAIGECEKNARYMKGSCPVACQTCLDLDINKRCKWDPTQPIALEPGDLHQMFETLVTSPEFQKYNPTTLSQPSDDKTKDGPWVVTLDDFVSEEECEMLIQAGAHRGYIRSEGGAGESDDGEYLSSVSDYRTSYQTWCLDECYKDPATIKLSERITNITGVAETHSEYLQLLKYKEGQYYKEHHDFIDVHVRRPMGPRILTVFLYLNEPEEGGGTRFPQLDLTVMPKRGRALIWPSVQNDDPMAIDKRTDHEALPVVKGEKYGANAWLHMGNFKDAFDKNCHFN